MLFYCNEYITIDNNTIHYHYFSQKILNHIDDLFENNRNRVQIFASYFTNCEGNSYCCDRNVSHRINTKQFFRFNINLI